MKTARQTHQRASILQQLESSDGFQSAQELHDQMARRGAAVGLATVYRTLQALALAGEVDVLRDESGETLYRRCDTAEHHHHLVCRGCGYSVEVPSEEIEKWASKVARRHRFTQMTHVAELFGICMECSADS